MPREVDDIDDIDDIDDNSSSTNMPLSDMRGVRDSAHALRRVLSTTSNNNNNNDNNNNNNQNNTSLSLRRMLAAAGTATVVGLGIAAMFDFLESRENGRESRIETFGRGIGNMFGVDLGAGGPGLSNEEIARLPTRVVGRGGRGNRGKVRAVDEKCAICQCEYESRDELRMLPCMHEFHKSCLQAWIDQHRDCPVCRSNIDVTGGSG